MKKFSTTEYKILTLLQDSQCHNGNKLGSQLGISPAAIWKIIKHLIEQGAPIVSLNQRGYQLVAPLLLLNEEIITEELPANLQNKFNLHLFSTIESTNSYLKKIPREEKISVCCAEKQLQGRGRFGRHWHSPFGENIYLSTRWYFSKDLSSLSCLSLVVSLVILETVHCFLDSPSVMIKWPNDLIWQNKKLSGSLIEIQAESRGLVEVIIGIGLNVNTDTKHQKENVDKPWCSMYEITKQHFNRNQIIAKLLSNLYEKLDLFDQFGFDYFLNDWEQYDALYGQEISLSTHSGSYRGQALGINATGQLKIQNQQEGIDLYSSGDTTLCI
jgi:BirA family biotin operon repressor/biotin-[acetyl-CoA-carboxylase] ligase